MAELHSSRATAQGGLLVVLPPLGGANGLCNHPWSSGAAGLLPSSVVPLADFTWCRATNRLCIQAEPQSRLCVKMGLHRLHYQSDHSLCSSVGKVAGWALWSSEFKLCPKLDETGDCFPVLQSYPLCFSGPQGPSGCIPPLVGVTFSNCIRLQAMFSIREGS